MLLFFSCKLKKFSVEISGDFSPGAHSVVGQNIETAAHPSTREMMRISFQYFCVRVSVTHSYTHTCGQAGSSLIVTGKVS